MFVMPVSTFRVSTIVLAGRPGLFLPWVGFHNSNEEAGSPGCLRQLLPADVKDYPQHSGVAAIKGLCEISR